jgi:hypothetical protein
MIPRERRTSYCDFKVFANFLKIRKNCFFFSFKKHFEITNKCVDSYDIRSDEYFFERPSCEAQVIYDYYLFG